MAMTKVKGLQMWCARIVEGYRDVGVRDMTSSWKSGLAFCAIIHNYRPDLIDYDQLSKENIFENNQLAFEVAERELGIPALLEAQDMVDIRVPDKLSVVTYVSQYYNYFRDQPQMGGPGVSVKQSSSSPVKRSPAISQPATGSDHVKRFTPSNDKNVTKTTPRAEHTKKTSTLGDRCMICQNKVYIMERLIENGKLYHRSCFRHSELSPTAKLVKSSQESPFDDLASKAKVRKTEEAPSWTRSNGLKDTKSNGFKDEKKSFPATQNSDVPSMDHQRQSNALMERLKSRVEVDTKEKDIPSYKKNRPLVLQIGAKDSGSDKDLKISPTFNARKFDKHESGFLSKDKSEKKSDVISDFSKTKDTGAKTSFLDTKSNYGKKITVEKMDTSEPFGAKLKHVSPKATRKNVTDNTKSNKSVDVRPKTPPFSKKVLTSKDTPPDSPPPPLPSSRPPSKLASLTSPIEESAPPVPTSLPPSGPPPSKSIFSSAPTKSTSSTQPNTALSSTSKGILKTTTTSTSTTKGILKTTTTTVTTGPSKPPRMFAESRSESPMDVDEAFHKAYNHVPGEEPVAVLVVPTEKNPIREKRLLGGLLASLANVRQNKPEDVKSPTDTVEMRHPVPTKRTEIKSEIILSKSKDETKSKTEFSVPKSKSDIDVPSYGTDKKKTPFSFGDKVGILKKNDNKSDTPKKDISSSKVSDSSKSSAITDSVSKYSSRSDELRSKDIGRPPAHPEPTWKKEADAKAQKTSKNVLLKDSDLSSNKTKTVDDVPSWKKDLDKNKDKSKYKSDLLSDSKSKDSKVDSSQDVPSWKQKLDLDKNRPKSADLLQENKSRDSKVDSSRDVPSWKQKLDMDRKQPKSADLLLDSKSKQTSDSNDQPEWMRALEKLEKRKGDKTRPKSADILSDESSKSDLLERRTKEDKNEKDRPKSTTVLDTNSSNNPGKLSWQMEAERRKTKEFVDPEKKRVEAPQKKPRTLITSSVAEPSAPKIPTTSSISTSKTQSTSTISSTSTSTITTPSKIKIAPISESNNTSSPPQQRLKKISPDKKFEFKTLTPPKTMETTSPLRTPPSRPPPPMGGNYKTPSPGRMSPAIIQRQLDHIDTKLTDLELRGRQLEDSIRSVDTTEAEDDMMIEWFKLINSKNELVRQEADLIYMSKQQELEDEQEDIDSMLRFLLTIPDEEKTDSQRRREADLFEKKMAIIEQRNDIVDSIDEDRIRYEEEDKDIAIMLEEKGFMPSSNGKMKKKKKQKEKARKGAFVSYASLSDDSND